MTILDLSYLNQFLIKKQKPKMRRFSNSNNKNKKGLF